MIQRGSGTSFTNLWDLLLSIQSLLHYIENSQENKKNTILSFFVCTKYSEIRNDLFLSISDLSQLINISLLTSAGETLSYADNCFIFYE
jgi:hypothetical protein